MIQIQGCSKWGMYKSCDDECTEKQRNKCQAVRDSNAAILAAKRNRFIALYPDQEGRELTPAFINRALNENDNYEIVKAKQLVILGITESDL